MILLRKQVTSLKLSKQLKKLGVKQDSLWYWEKRTFLLKAPDWLKNTNDITLVDCDYEKKENWKHYSFKYCSAFTVAELGELLPQYVESYRIATDRFACKFCELKEDKKGNPVNGEPIIKVCDTEADARAKMLIYLIEHKLMGANK